MENENENESEEMKFISNPVELKNTLLNNLKKGVLTKIKIQEKDVRREDCAEKCGEKECKIMEERQRNLDACNKCHSNPKKCYKKSISGGNCEYCLDGEKQIQCNNVSNFGCFNPNNLDNIEGVDPYFVIKTNYSKNNDISQECRFCYDFTDLI